MNPFHVLITLLFVSLNIHADECRTELRKEDSYADLSAILSCLAVKNQRLEMELKQLKSQKEEKLLQVDGSSEKCKPEKTDIFTASLYTVLINDTINARLNIQNTTAEPLLVALDYERQPTLSDEKYALTAAPDTTPMGMQSSTIGSDKEDAYTKLLAGQIYPINFSFKPDLKLLKTSNGNTNITVSANFLRLTNKGKVERITVAPCAIMKVGDQ